MSKSLLSGTFAIVLIAFCLPARAEAEDLLESLRPENFSHARFNLIPGGAQIGFELEIAGDAPLLGPLVAIIRNAEPGGGHKCPNAGAIRFRMNDGSVVGVGLLPSHTEGRYEFRLYEGDRYLDAFIVERKELLAALEQLGLPMDDPAFE